MVSRRHESSALKYFTNLTDREHAIFEAGISLGAIFHQLIGMPVDLEKLDELEAALSSTFSIQPFRTKIEIKIDAEKIKKGLTKPYNYGVITPESLSIKVVVEYGEARVTARLEWIDEIGFPLMYVQEAT
ncbi:MAG: dihydroneopterin aldolase family protein [Nitrososphaerota archaeon]